MDALADDGRTVEVALDMARRAAEMPAVMVWLVNEEVDVTATALNLATAFADGDESQLTGASRPRRHPGRDSAGAEPFRARQPGSALM